MKKVCIILLSLILGSISYAGTTLGTLTTINATTALYVADNSTHVFQYNIDVSVNVTLVEEGSIDGGRTYFPLADNGSSRTYSSDTTTSSYKYEFPFDFVRVRVTAKTGDCVVTVNYKGK